MFHISITLIDSDIPFSLPAKWGKDYQIVEIQPAALNGKTALLLTLTTVVNPEINEFPPGLFPIGRTSRNYGYFVYLPCIYHPYPLSIGSAYGTIDRVSEIKKVVKEIDIYEEGTWKHKVTEVWRLTLTKRRDPIVLLPNRDE